MLGTLNPIFDIHPNYTKSKGSNIYCNKHNKLFLDFFGSFSSLPYGYNPDFLNNTDFFNRSKEFLSIRTPLCAYESSVKLEYVTSLNKLCNANHNFSSVLFAETGALAVELALKAFILNSIKPIKIYTFENSYHGIYGLAGGLTIGSNTALPRLQKINTILKGYNCVYNTISNVTQLNNISDFSNSVLFLEPIQCTSGDINLNKQYYSIINDMQKEGLTLIADEIQTGYLSTGYFWASDKLKLSPDIIIFGKKFQVCGCLLTSKYNYLLENNKPKYFSSTYDANLIDMLRGLYYNLHLIDNFSYYSNRVLQIEKVVSNNLNSIIPKNSFRVNGLFFAIDFVNSSVRDEAVKTLFKSNILCNPTAQKSIRFRSNLDTSDEELDLLLNTLSSLL